MHGVISPQMIGSLVPAEEGYILVKALFFTSCSYGIDSFPLPRGIHRTLGVTLWNWEFDSGFLRVEFWHIRVKF